MGLELRFLFHLPAGGAEALELVEEGAAGDAEGLGTFDWAEAAFDFAEGTKVASGRGRGGGASALSLVTGFMPNLASLPKKPLPRPLPGLGDHPRLVAGDRG